MLVYVGFFHIKWKKGRKGFFISPHCLFQVQQRESSNLQQGIGVIKRTDEMRERKWQQPWKDGENCNKKHRKGGDDREEEEERELLSGRQK